MRLNESRHREIKDLPIVTLLIKARFRVAFSHSWAISIEP